MTARKDTIRMCTCVTWNTNGMRKVTSLFLLLLNTTVKVKVKFTPEQSMKSQKGSRSIAVFFL